ncbi:ParB N-terminal domain-containing protein [Caulobacter sp. UNC279MFTsu5.1]|uniref:ParB N-terminal domain-containing protein n=1 Tax=Caulobacter sp. UNC279MFTsu5.1 TaxID=1502775 RepID=UPI0003636482|nr:ParB N-terminal domain-containing protein [Caulobacter sp. UNC279MFTsu5.1]SFK42181.1 ParB/RepB/Spo0J family partition protein [Caulobacter sp. UNC279MFTsu5.1]
MSALTPLALTFADILRHLQDSKVGRTHAEVAKATARDTSNTRRDLGKLADAGLISAEASDPPKYFIARAGVDALDALGRAEDPSAGGAAVWPHDKIARNPANPRKTFPAEKIAEIAESIVEVGGLLHNLVLRPADANGVRMLHDGECRWRACDLLISQDRLPPALAEGLPFTEREGTEEEALFVALIANAQRGDLSPWEDAQGLAAYKALTGLSARAVAFKLGRAIEGSERGVKDVQQKIKAVEEATPTNIALHESGVWTWEQLRESVQTEKASPAATGEGEASRQVELEQAISAAAQEDEEPTEHMALMLVEVAAAIRAKPFSHPLAVGRSTRVTEIPTVNDNCHPAEKALLQGGYITFNYFNGGSAVSLLSRGEKFVARMIYAGDDGLRFARTDALHDDEEHDRLQEAGEYWTYWLNLPKPPSAGPAPTVRAEHALILLEIHDAFKRQPGGYMGDNYQGVPMRFNAPPGVIANLRSEDLITGGDPEKPSSDGSTRIKITNRAERALMGQWKAEVLTSQSVRTKVIGELREALLGRETADKCRKAKAYATEWLNAPFPVSPAAQALLDRKAQSERDRAAHEAKEKARLELAERRLAELEAVAPTMELPKLGAKIRQMLEEATAAAPWTAVANSYNFARTASGTEITVRASRSARLAILALNAVTGCWPEADEAPVTPMAFEAWIAETLTEEHSVSDAVVASVQAVQALKRYEQDSGCAFGDDGFEWDRETARQIANDWAEDFIEDGQVVRAPLASEGVAADHMADA